MSTADFLAQQWPSYYVEDHSDTLDQLNESVLYILNRNKSGLTAVRVMQLLQAAEMETEPEQFAPLWCEAAGQEEPVPMELSTSDVESNVLGLSAEESTGRGFLRCIRCGSYDTEYELDQTRSADEMATAQVVCRQCFKRWSKN